MKNRLLLSMLLLAGAAHAQSSDTIRICDASGCSDRPRDSATFDPTHDEHPEETRRLAALADIARKDPRAAYDLALRHYRGDGVKRDSYQAIRWMREAGDRGVPEAQLALGRFYLSGVEEMGADPAEAEKWLSLAEARSAKKTEQELYQWRQFHRQHWLGWWVSGYPYHWYWGTAGWYYR